METTIQKLSTAIYHSVVNRSGFIHKYYRKISEILTQSIILVFAVAVMMLGLLYLGKVLWHLYVLTSVGQQFVIIFESRSELLYELFNRDLASLSIAVSIISFIVCMMVSAACQVLHLTRHLYLSRGMFGKLILWHLPLTALVAHHLEQQLSIRTWQLPYAVAFIPTLCVFTYCFTYTSRLLPQLGDVLRIIAGWLKRMFFCPLPQPKNSDNALPTSRAFSKPSPNSRLRPGPRSTL